MDDQLPPGEQGEILVGGPTVISGYLDAPELNRACFLNGWFKSGDIGSIDEDGFLTLHGRKNDLINRGGEKISPVEIDEALMRHPAVAEAAAFSVPHSRLGEDVAAAVVLRPGMTATPVELRRYLQDQVASFKVPRRIVIRDQLPKGETGKVLRRRLTKVFGMSAAAENQIAASQTVSDEPVDSQLVNAADRHFGSRLLKIEPLSLDDDFFEKGGDSLLAMDMLAEVDLLIGRTIPASILFEATTIRQLAQKLSERSNLRAKISRSNSSSRTPTTANLFPRRLHRGWSIRDLAAGKRCWVPTSHFLLSVPHGADDEPFRVRSKPWQPTIALDRESPAEGPYRLCGNCLGGIVAFEVARLLVAAGRRSRDGLHDRSANH